MQALDVHHIPLENYNLIEASAGTGKTYSIAILTLRILLETDIPIHEILMVTFTKAAVAELQIRIRKFIQLASFNIDGDAIDDTNIEQIVNKNIEKYGYETINRRINNASLLLDEMAIMTIHSFCQQTLTEFAFESNQMFGTEMTTDDTSLIATFVNDYWRTYITSLPVTILELIDGANFLNPLNEILLSHLNGKPLKWYNTQENYTLPKDYDESMDSDTILQQIMGHAIHTISTNINDYKRKANILGFNDLIHHLATALKGPNSDSLVLALQKKYKAVFVDEFQDTDKDQYFIFKKAFREHTIVFLIGDPKQSIYAFRQADLFVYFQAKADAMPNVFTMNTNYRSTPQIINALNTFFLPSPTFDTFHYKHLGIDLNYYPVLPKDSDNAASLYLNNSISTPIDIFICPKNEAIHNLVVAHVSSLLTNDDHYFLNSQEKKKILPQHIGILVKSNRTGIEIKNKLQKIGIPAVMVDETKIFQTSTATELYYFLKAIQQPNLANINSALLTTICNKKIETLETTNTIEEYFPVFQQGLLTWEKDGFYAAMLKFIAYFNIKSRIDNDQDNGALRLYTNLIQLTEIIHKAQVYRKLNIGETIDWYNNLLSGKINAEDEHILRIEHDTDAVQITTIHKSKGLEYDIVLLPEIDFVVNGNLLKNRNLVTINELKDNLESQYFAIYTASLTEEERSLFFEQTEQENRRLIYVAMTRAKHKIFMYSTALKTKNPKSRTGLQVFAKALQDSIYDQQLIHINSDLALETSKKYKAKKKTQSVVGIPLEQIELPSNNWMKISFTAINSHNASILYERNNNHNTPYDTFIFQQLKAGSYTGTAIHSLLERIEFDNTRYWQYLVEQLPAITNDAKIDYTPLYIEMLQHIFDTSINIGATKFCLNEINQQKRLNELEFYFPIANFEVNKIKQIKPERFEWNARLLEHDQIIGFMNGLIDLVFEFQNKYYILDWKTNFLGDDIMAYNENNIIMAMNHNNYHLQYMVYITALNKYLKQRKPDYNYDKDFGGVIYLFIRGMRQHSNTGIFTYKPTAKLVEQFESIFNSDNNL